MVLIITFLAGFYLGFVVLSLLVMARKNAYQPLAKFSHMPHLRKVNQMMRGHRSGSADHGFRGSGNII